MPTKITNKRFWTKTIRRTNHHPSNPGSIWANALALTRGPDSAQKPNPRLRVTPSNPDYWVIWINTETRALEVIQQKEKRKINNEDLKRRNVESFSTKPTAASEQHPDNVTQLYNNAEVALMFPEGAVAVTMRFVVDSVTAIRPLQFEKKEDAEKFLAENKGKLIFGDTKEDQEAFEQEIQNPDNPYVKAKKEKYGVTHNEVLIRGRWTNECKIAIGQDTVEAKLLALEYAEVLKQNLKRQKEEYEDYDKNNPGNAILPPPEVAACWADNYEIPFYFHSAVDKEKHGTEWTLQELVKDVVNKDLSLHAAIERNKVDLATILIRGGADLTLKNEDGKTPRELEGWLYFEKYQKLIATLSGIKKIHRIDNIEEVKNVLNHVSDLLKKTTTNTELDILIDVINQTKDLIENPIQNIDDKRIESYLNCAEKIQQTYYDDKDYHQDAIIMKAILAASMIALAISLTLLVAMSGVVGAGILTGLTLAYINNITACIPFTFVSGGFGACFSLFKQKRLREHHNKRQPILNKANDLRRSMSLFGLFTRLRESTHKTFSQTPDPDNATIRPA